MITKSRNRPLWFAWDYLALAALSIAMAADRTVLCNLTEVDARRALLAKPTHFWPPQLRELETEPLVVRTTPAGETEWHIGGWRIYPNSRRFEYVPPHPFALHFKCSGDFERTGCWRVWEVTNIGQVYVNYRPMAGPRPR